MWVVNGEKVQYLHNVTLTQDQTCGVKVYSVTLNPTKGSNNACSIMISTNHMTNYRSIIIMVIVLEHQLSVKSKSFSFLE